MNQDVPQPTTATCSPGRGRSARLLAATAIALRQASGCRLISSLTCDTVAPYETVESGRSALGSGERNALHHPTLQNEEHHDQWQGRDQGPGHEDGVVGEVLALQIRDADTEGHLLRVVVDH